MAVSEQSRRPDRGAAGGARALVARGIATAPIFVEHAHGARLTDVDGREYIDFVGGIGILNGGHTPERVVRGDPGAGREVPAPVLLDRAVRAVHRGLPAPLPVPSGRRAVQGRCSSTRAPRRSRTPSRSRATPPAARPSSCFDQAFHGRTLMAMTPDLEGDAVQEGLRPVRARGLPRARPVPVPRHRHGADAIAGGQGKLFKSQVDPSAVAGRDLRAGAGRGRLPARRPRASRRRSTRSAREHGIVYIDDEVQAGMCRTGTGGVRSSTTASSPTSACGASRWAAACRSPASPAAPSCMDARARGRPRRHVRRQPDLLRRRHRGARRGARPGLPGAARASSATACAPGSTTSPPASTPSATCAASAPCWPSSSSRTATTKAPAAGAGRPQSVELARERGLLLMGAGIYSNVHPRPRAARRHRRRPRRGLRDPRGRAARRERVAALAAAAVALAAAAGAAASRSPSATTASAEPPCPRSRRRPRPTSSTAPGEGELVVAAPPGAVPAWLTRGFTRTRAARSPCRRSPRRARGAGGARPRREHRRRARALLRQPAADRGRRGRGARRRSAGAPRRPAGAAARAGRDDGRRPLLRPRLRAGRSTCWCPRQRRSRRRRSLEALLDPATRARWRCPTTSSRWPPRRCSTASTTRTRSRERAAGRRRVLQAQAAAARGALRRRRTGSRALLRRRRAGRAGRRRRPRRRWRARASR